MAKGPRLVVDNDDWIGNLVAGVRRQDRKSPQERFDSALAVLEGFSDDEGVELGVYSGSKRKPSAISIFGANAEEVFRRRGLMVEINDPNRSIHFSGPVREIKNLM